MAENVKPSDAPPPAPPPPPDAGKVRSAAGAVGAQDQKRQPAQVELLRANVQDKVDQARNGAALLADKVKDGAEAVQRKAPEVVRKAAAIAGAGAIIASSHLLDRAILEAKLLPKVDAKEQVANVDGAKPTSVVRDAHDPKREDIQRKGDAAQKIKDAVDEVGERIIKKNEEEAAKNREQRRHD